MRHGRSIAAVLAAATTLAIGPAVATAATASLADDSVADFSQGTSGSATTVVAPGTVQLAQPMATQPFDGGPALPADLTETQWTPPAGSATVASSALLVQGELVKQNQVYDPGQVIEFTATFAQDAFEHVGFGTTFDPDAPYAIISTNTGGSTLYARTRAAHGTETTTALSVTAGAPHSFRIEWSATDVKYYVDGNLEVTHPVAIASQMSPLVSDAVAADGPGVSVDSLGLLGTFQSRALDAGDPHAAWTSLHATGAGGDLSFETRSGNDGTTWSAWQAVDLTGAIQSPSARYIQYRALLTGGGPATVERVQIDYTDDNAPDATIDGMQVTGTTATLAFSSPAADLAGFECAVDGGAFAACASPKELTGLAPGAHTVDVRAVDRPGNKGQAVTRSFSIDGPPATEQQQQQQHERHHRRGGGLDGQGRRHDRAPHHRRRAVGARIQARHDRRPRRMPGDRGQLHDHGRAQARPDHRGAQDGDRARRDDREGHPAAHEGRPAPADPRSAPEAERRGHRARRGGEPQLVDEAPDAALVTRAGGR